MNIYESIIILNAALTDEEINASTAKIKDIVINAGGEVLKTDNWGRRKLAYEIKKQNKGCYLLLIYKAPPSIVRKMEEFFKVSDQVIKYMIIKLGPKQIKQFEATQTAEAEKVKSEA